MKIQRRRTILKNKIEVHVYRGPQDQCFRRSNQEWEERNHRFAGFE